MLIVGEDAPGTAEAFWLGAGAVTAAAEVEWGAPGRLVVLAPHPDDETLPVGGTLSMLARRGFSVEVVAVTDGEASHPRSPTTTPLALARRRTRERVEALRALGIAEAPVARLSIADGQVAAAGALMRSISERVRGAALVMAPFARDGHPDHDAVGQAARGACRSASVRLLSFLVWAWHWATPADDLPWEQFRRSTLDDDARRAKAAAIACHVSQIEPLSRKPGDERILTPAVLARFARPFETFIEEDLS